MKQIDKIVRQLDPGDLEKPFDIIDRKIRITARTCLAARPRKPLATQFGSST